MSNGTSIAQQVPVLLPLPLAGPLNYQVPAHLGRPVTPGDIVVVPLNGRERIGVVWDGTGETGLPEHRLKTIAGIVPNFSFGETLRRFIDWLAAYTLSAPGDVLAMALRTAALGEDAPSCGVRRPLTPAASAARLSEGRQRVLAALGTDLLPAADLARRAGVSRQTIRLMVQGGLLDEMPMPARPAQPVALPPRTGTPLSQDQQQAASALQQAVDAGRFSVTLLQGATGSGKTEVYFEAVRACVAQGRQALILLPEIALSAQWLQRFEQRFGRAPAQWHSDLGMRSRRETWRAVARGQVTTLVGARSALFLPFPDLGLIIVDEEHESAFKQEDGVIYHARDMAVVRGRLCDAAVILASATPSLESLANVQSGRYARLDLPNRFGGAVLPQVAALDLRVYPPARGRFLSPVLLDGVAQALARGEQALLFLNRRGYAPLTLCRACGHRIQCPNCTAWLVEHRLRRVLTCHHCAHTEPVPTRCGACGTENSLVAVGPGVERITEEITAQFPDARLVIMASDTLPGPHAAAAAAAAVERQDVDLIIGTQIVAKGWHFPHLTMVGVVDADLGLSGGDLRAGERTMQLLHQVAGRAGRAKAPGQVLLQTYQPEHPVIQALVSGDLERFMRAEAVQRRPGHWPPYGRLAALIVSAERPEDADDAARALGRAAPRGEGIVVLGPAPAPLAILRGRHRRRLLLRTTREVAVQPLLRHWLGEVKARRGVRVDVDVDPTSFL